MVIEREGWQPREGETKSEIQINGDGERTMVLASVVVVVKRERRWWWLRERDAEVVERGGVMMHE